MQTDIRSEGWGVVVPLDELEVVLSNISDRRQAWRAQLVDSTDELPRVDILYATTDEEADLTSDGISFPGSVDWCPLLTRPPLAMLHPSLLTHVYKAGAKQIDPAYDFDIIWTPLREALALELLCGAARTLLSQADHRRRSNGR